MSIDPHASQRIPCPEGAGRAFPREPKLAGKTAVITGAGGGIGRATTLRFLEEGAQVLGVDLNEGSLRELGRATPDAGGQFRPLVSDVAAPEAGEEIVAAALAAFGRLDILVNNAGIECRSSLAEQGDELWRRVLDVNLSAPFRLCRAAAGRLAESGRGAIVNIASVAVVGFAGQAAYDASKGGLQTLTRSLAVELGAKGIRANSVCPGFIDTEMVRTVPSLYSIADRFARSLPIPRLGFPTEVAAAVSWLASDAASYVTGHSLFVDGGWIRR